MSASIALWRNTKLVFLGVPLWIAACSALVAQTPPTAEQVESQAALTYRWQPGEPFGYELRVEAARASFLDVFEATCVYRAGELSGASTTLVCQGQAIVGRMPNPRRPVGGYLVRAREASPSGPIVPVPRSSIHLSDTGRIRAQGGTGLSTWWLGDMANLPLLPLGDKPAEQWTTQRACLAFDQGMIAGLALTGVLDKEQRAAVEQFNLRETKRDGDAVEFALKYDLRSEATDGGEPKVEAHGAGTAVFDTATGHFRAIDIEMLVTQLHNSSGAIHYVKLPLKVRVRELPSDQVPRAAADWALLASRGQDDSREDDASPASVYHQLAEALAGLSAEDVGTRIVAANRISRIEPQGDRRRVVHKLLELFESENDAERKAAVEAVARWGSTDDVPALAVLLSDTSFDVRWTVLDSLGAMEDRKAAEAIAWHLELGNDQSRALRALAACKTAAVPLAETLLANQDWNVRREACRLLREYGAASSMDPLRKLTASETNTLVLMSAEEALRAIDDRAKEAATSTAKD